MTVIVITHYMEEVVGCDKVFVMDGGRVTACGTPREIFENQAVLDRAGLELPVAAKISQKLRTKGIDIGLTLTKGELKEKLWTLLSKN